MYSRKRCNLTDQCCSFFYRSSELAFLLCNIYLDQDIDFHLLLHGFSADLFRQPEAVHAVDQVNLIYNIFYLIALQMADHMPSDIRRHLRDLVHQFLNLVLPEISGSRTVDIHQHIHRFGLADCKQRHFLLRSARLLTGFCDVLFYRFVILCQFHALYGLFHSIRHPF